MTSATSGKQYQITFYKGDPLIVNEAIYNHLSQEDEHGVMLIDRVKTIKLKGRILRTADISGIDLFRDYEAENRWSPPEPHEIDQSNLALLRQAKKMILGRPKGEPFDPDKHLPEAWRDGKPAKYVHEFDGLKIVVTSSQQEDIDSGIARIDWEGIYPAVVYDYEKVHKQTKMGWADKYRSDYLDQLIAEAPDEEATP